MISLKNVTKVYNSKEIDQVVLSNVKLDIQDGEMLAIIGPSGSGKTTLLNIIGGIDTPTGGEIILNNQSINYHSKMQLNKYRKENISFIFQNFNLMDDYTVRENIELPLQIQGIPRKQRHAISEKLLRDLDITNIRSKYPKSISGGEKQRCAIARAMAADRKIVLADEPTGALDSANGENIMNLFDKIHTKDRIIVIVTHNSDIAKRCDRIVRLFDGKVVE